MQYSLTFPSGTVKYILHLRFAEMKQFIEPEHSILLVDCKVAELYADSFKGYRTILVEADEHRKSWEQVENICEQLLSMGADRGTTLIGVGGGIVTDLTGFVASVYMRGVAFGFVPTTLLGMCDAAIGGKNGVNLGLQKNLLGIIRQPSFIFYDAAFLKTLSATEWSNGFAEVIKYACLFDIALFDELEKNSVEYYQNNDEALQLLIERCVDHKNNVVLADEQESGKRKLLNFGHTAGHAIETLYEMPHGFAVSVGMVIACKISEKETKLNAEVTDRVKKLLEQYGLPTSAEMETKKVMEVLAMDKKKNSEGISYILLKNIGEAEIKTLSPDQIRNGLETYSHAGSR